MAEPVEIHKNTARVNLFFTSTNHVFPNVQLQVMKLARMKIDVHQI